MRSKKCPACGRAMKRNGKTIAGTQRWRCTSCGASTTHGNDVTARELDAQLRAMLRNHRGMSLLRRIKAVCWWCYMHTECPKSAAEIMRSMPTDEDTGLLYELYAEHPREDGEPEWGETPVWQELHSQTPYPYVTY